MKLTQKNLKHFVKVFFWPIKTNILGILCSQFHWHEIIDNCLVPVGCLGEHASESRNKLYKSDRRRHARKCSRLDTMTDIFNRALDTSDPLLSSIYLKERQRKNKNKNMPQEVISLLKSPCVGSDHDDHGDCQEHRRGRGGR